MHNAVYFAGLLITGALLGAYVPLAPVLSLTGAVALGSFIIIQDDRRYPSPWALAFLTAVLLFAGALIGYLFS